jgi:hypothetical protein
MIRAIKNITGKRISSFVLFFCKDELGKSGIVGQKSSQK